MSKSNNNFSKGSQKRSTNNKKKGKPYRNTAPRSVESDLQEFQCNHNDISWYNANPTMLRTAGSLSFNNALGIDIFQSLNDFEGSTADPATMTVPGIMAFDMVPTIGQANDPNSIVNIAARKIYAYVRHENSGHTNYDAPDLMLYILAMDNLYSFYNWITRLYGAIRLYSGTNRYFSDQLIRAMHVDHNDIRKHGNDLYFNLLDWAARLKTFHIPSTMSYLTRHAWLFSQVFKDSPDSKSQVYLFTPSHLYYWAENAGQWSLEPIQIIPTVVSGIPLLTYDKIVELMEKMIAGVARSEDFNIMSGDILKAYGNNTFTISPVDISYILEPTFNNSVLMQIHNLRILDNYAAGSIHNDGTGSYLVNSSVCDNDAKCIYLSHNLVLDLHGEEPTPENVMIATRLSANFKVKSGSTREELDNYGSEVVTACFVYSMDDDQSKLPPELKTDYKVEDATRVDDTAAILSALGSYLPFGEFPITYRTDVTTLGEEKLSHGVTQIYNNFDNYTIISSSVLRKLHDCALLSEFGITEN